MNYETIYSAIAHALAGTNAEATEIALATDNVLNALKSLPCERCGLLEAKLESAYHRSEGFPIDQYANRTK